MVERGTCGFSFVNRTQQRVRGLPTSSSWYVRLWYLHSTVSRALEWWSRGPGSNPHWGAIFDNLFCSYLSDNLTRVQRDDWWSVLQTTCGGLSSSGTDLDSIIQFMDTCGHVFRYVGWKRSAAMLAAKRSAGVAPEVWDPPRFWNPGQMSTGVSVVSQKELVSFKKTLVS